MSDDINLDFLKTEYTEAGDNWRFLVGLRFRLLTIFVTLVSVLFSGYFFVILNSNYPIIRYLIIVIGIIITISIWILEIRNRDLYRACINRGRDIEGHFGINDGQCSKIMNCYSRKFNLLVTHSRGLDIIYVLILSGWVVLLILECLIKCQLISNFF